MDIQTTIKDKAITAITAAMEAKNLDRFLVRAENAMAEIGMVFLGPTKDEGKFGFSITPPILEVDLSGTVAIEDMLTRIEKRANKKLSDTDHPFSFYDFKQALGIVADVKAGLHDAEKLSDFLEGRRTPKPKKVKTVIKTKVKVTGKSVNLKPVPESDAVSDRINKALDKVTKKVDAKNAKARAKADAELDAKIKATDEAIAAEEVLEKEKEDIKKTKIKKGKAKPKK